MAAALTGAAELTADGAATVLTGVAGAGWATG